jgi:hypothetical protein
MVNVCGVVVVGFHRAKTVVLATKGFLRSTWLPPVGTENQPTNSNPGLFGGVGPIAGSSMPFALVVLVTLAGAPGKFQLKVMVRTCGVVVGFHRA